MAKFKFTLSIGIAGAKQKDIIEIPDEELDGLESAERDAVVEEYWQEWKQGYVDGGWDEIEGEEQ